MAGIAREPDFLTLADVGERLNASQAQVYSLVRDGELRGMKIGGRGIWRVHRDDLEAYIERQYAKTAEEIARSKRAASEAKGPSETDA